MSLARQVPAEGKQHGVLRRIAAALPALSPAERRVADRVLEDPGRVVVLSINDFAGECGVAQPTVSRFARSIGFAGYPALRFAIAHDIAAGGTGSDPGPAGLGDLGEQLAADSAVAELAELLRGSSGAEIWAAGELAGAASLVAARLHAVGIRTAASAAPAHWMLRSSGMRSGDVLVAMLAGPIDRRLDRALASARERGATLAVVSTAHVAAPSGTDLTVLLPEAGSAELAGAVFSEVLAAEIDALGGEVGPDGPASPWLPWPHVRELLIPTDSDPVPALLLDRRPGTQTPVVLYFSGFTGAKENGLLPGVSHDRIGPGMVAALLNSGYSVLLMDAPAHGARKRQWEQTRELVAASLAGETPDLQDLSRRTIRFVVDELLARDLIASPDRFAVLGQSWGGYQTLLALEGDDRIAAGVAIMPISHACDLPEYADHRDGPRGRSATIDAGRIRTPLLLISGLADTVASPNRIRELHARLAPAFAARGAEADLELAELPEVGHHLHPSQMELALRFLDEHLPVER